jgi:hypothetical protein
MARSSGRYSKFPKVDRSITGPQSTAAERLGLVESTVVATPEPEPVRPAVNPEPEVEVQGEVEVPDLGDMTVIEVLEWVGDDDDRRDAVLSAEQAGRRRKGVLNGLQR